jgi:hypothetical protein
VNRVGSVGQYPGLDNSYCLLVRDYLDLISKGISSLLFLKIKVNSSSVGFAAAKERTYVCSAVYGPLAPFVLVKQTEISRHLEDFALVANYIVPCCLHRGAATSSNRLARPVRLSGLR